MDGEFKGYVFIDVRGEDEFRQGHVPGAVNISVGQIDANHPKLKDIDSGTNIVVYCAAGGRASQAKLKLEALGFSNVTNGINKNEVEQRFFA